MKKRMTSFAAIAVSAFTISTVTGAVLSSGAFAENSTESNAPSPGAVSVEDALDAWAQVYEVVSHPRCANCHVADDRPRWSGPSYGLADGEWKFHGMNIHGGADRIGLSTLPCTTCHSVDNSDTPHGPPGNTVWMLAPIEMVWWQKSSQEICEQIKDPARNGGRSLAEVADHVSHDGLVAWGFNPGPGREPAPYSSEHTADMILTWASGGAPCPSDDPAQ